jgi:hypothetical protein
MAWMTMWHFAADVERPGRSTRISERGKTSSASPAGCIEPWSSSMDLKSAYLGKASLTRKHSLPHYSMASQSCQVSGLVAT